MEYPNDFCAITEIRPDRFHQTKLSVHTFIKHNQWFDGVLLILSLGNSSLLMEQRLELNLIYDRIEIIEVDPAELDVLKKKAQRFKPDSADLHDYLYTLVFKIKSRGNLYFSSSVIFNKSADLYLDQNQATFARKTGSFPTGSGYEINLAAFYIPGSLTSDLLYKTVINRLKSHKNISHMSSDSIIRSLQENNISIKYLNKIGMY